MSGGDVEDVDGSLSVEVLSLEDVLLVAPESEMGHGLPVWPQE